MLWFRCNEIIPGASLAILFIIFWLGIFFAYHEVSLFIDEEPYCRMTDDPEDKMDAFRQSGQSAFILGYTGETGKRLTQLLARDKLFRKVTLIGRREIDLSDEVGPGFVQKIVDFDNLDDYSDVFSGHDVGFCCIGTTRAKAGVEGFKRVDHDYVLKAAQLAKAGGTRHFQFISTYAADHNSSGLYPRTKGQVEEALKVMHFERLSIFRPVVLLVDRPVQGTMEMIAQLILKPVSVVFPTAITIPIDTMVQAFINNVITPSDKYVETFENKQIHIMSGTSRYCRDRQKTDL